MVVWIILLKHCASYVLAFPNDIALDHSVMDTLNNLYIYMVLYNGHRYCTYLQELLTSNGVQWRNVCKTIYSYTMKKHCSFGFS